MPTIENVCIDDVYPWEDEYGNQILSRDYTTRENRRYVAELARSMRARGVPDEMVQLSRDGGIYRIVSGNSRVRAMRELGTRRFDAIVLDDVEADEAVRRAVEAAVRTNTKKKYEATELSGYVQQLAMFAGDEYVADAAGIEAEQVARVRRARRVVGDDGDGYTIERMCAIAEFGDDPGAVEALTKCPEREIAYQVARLRQLAEDEARAAEVRDALQEAGIVVLRDSPEGAIFCRYVVNAAQVAGAADDGPIAPTVAVRLGAGFRLYRMPNEDDREDAARVAAEAEEREIQKLADRAMAARLAERRAAWLEDRLANWDPRRLPRLQEAAIESVSDPRGVDWTHEHGIAQSAGPVEIAAFVTRLDDLEFCLWSYGWEGRGARTLDERGASMWAEVYGAMAADGYAMDDEEGALLSESEG